MRILVSQQTNNREKAIKNWKREWKIHVIEMMNPQWLDLYSDLL